jgi:hypothetical protein
MKKYLTIFVLIISAATACKKTINVDVNDAPTQVVIEGLVSNLSSAKVFITQSVKLSSDNVYPPVSGANIIITDNVGNTYQLSETANGIYTNSLIGVPGRTYNITATVQGTMYKATSTMPFPVNLDTLLTDKIAFGDKSIIDITPVYFDPPGFGNYYQFIQTINKTLNPHIFVFDDKYDDGAVNARPLVETDSTIKSGDSIAVEMRCIDKNVYTYFNALSQLGDNSTTPGNPPSNITGGCLGYFSAYTSQTKKIKVP